MDKCTKTIPSLKIQEKLYNDLARVLRAKNYRRTDYIRRAIADAVRRDLATVKEDGEHG